MAESQTELRELEQAVENSYVLCSLKHVSARLTEVAHRLIDASKQSYICRRLTREPDPEVVVIDLRETYTVGPIIAFIDWLVSASSPPVNTIDRAWQVSTLYRMGDWVAGWVEVAIESQTGQAILEILEPPEPSEEEK